MYNYKKHGTFCLSFGGYLNRRHWTDVCVHYKMQKLKAILFRGHFFLATAFRIKDLINIHDHSHLDSLINSRLRSRTLNRPETLLTDTCRSSSSLDTDVADSNLVETIVTVIGDDVTFPLCHQRF